MDRNNKITITEGEIWDFTLKETCKVIDCSSVAFVMSKLFKPFKRRVNYFIKSKRYANEVKNE